MLNIKIEKFEGPLDLLLKLIEKEELDITKISLARITDQYIDLVKNSPAIRPGEMADFLVLAARLLFIKSKALFPYIETDDEEDNDDLERQLRMYKEYLEAAKSIEAILKKNNFMFPREFNRKAIVLSINNFSPPKNLTAGIMASCLAEIIERVKPAQADLDEKKLEAVINIEDRILLIQKILTEKIKFNFKRLLEKAESKTEIIVSFLAMLELAKQNNIVIEQDELFGEMMIVKNGGF
ncbi:MAG: segregation/condensation protein A [Patescibacteria group bacterium]|jgi:segregation and condensation protein A